MILRIATRPGKPPAPARRERTFDDLAALDPRLLDLAAEARLRGGEPFDWPGWEAVKGQLRRLVGWHREDGFDPALSSREAYETCYRTLLDLMGG